MFMIREAEVLGMMSEDTDRSLFPESALHLSDTNSVACSSLDVGFCSFPHED